MPPRRPRRWPRATARTPPRLREPVSAAQAEALGPALGPAASDAEQSADPIDYSVAQDGTIRVAADETLGHYADWLGVTAARLRELNHLKFKTPVRIGERISLDFAQVTPEVFETLRHEYHRETAGRLLRRPPHRRHRGLHRASRRLAVDADAARGAAAVAGAAVQPRRRTSPTCTPARRS